MEAIIKKIYSRNRLMRYAMLLLGTLIMAISFNLFISPNNIVVGGVSGISIIVSNYFPINQSLFILAGSLFFLLISYLFLDKEQTSLTVLGSVLFPILVSLTSNVGNIFNIDPSDKLLLALFGGLLYGIGNGLVFKAGFTTGGTAVLNQIVNKYLKISMGTSMIMTDGLIVLLGAFIFGWNKFMYAIIILYIISIITDKVLIGISNSKAFYIITSKPEEISNYVIDSLNHSVTLFNAKGAYSNAKTKVLFTVIPTKEYYKFKAGIEEIDAEAFFTVLDAYEVLGGE